MLRGGREGGIVLPSRYARLTGRQTDRQTDRPTDIQTDGQSKNAIVVGRSRHRYYYPRPRHRIRRRRQHNRRQHCNHHRRRRSVGPSLVVHCQLLSSSIIATSSQAASSLAPPQGEGMDSRSAASSLALPLGEGMDSRSTNAASSLAPPQGEEGNADEDVPRGMQPDPPWSPWVWIRLRWGMSGEAIGGIHRASSAAALLDHLDEGDVEGVPAVRDSAKYGYYQLIWETSVLDDSDYSVLLKSLGVVDDTVLTVVYVHRK